jgi:hypothetical protein
LWPWASNLHKGRSVGEVVLRGENPGDVTRLYSQAIDWPEGVDRWPPLEPAEQWRDAVMPQDWGKPCRVRHEDGEWRQSVIQGKSTHCWAASGTWWAHCQVRVDPKPTGKDCLQVEDAIQELLTSLKKALNVMEKGIEVRMMDQWPVLQTILPIAIKSAKETIAKYAANQPTGWRELS